MTGPDASQAAVAAAIAAVRAGDRDAYRVVVAKYQRRMFGLALMITRNASAAEDVTQDAFVRAFERLDLYDAERPFGPWLSTITARLAHNWIARRANVVARESREPDSERDADDDAVDPLKTLMADESGRRLWRAVAALPSGQRAAVMLHYRGDMRVQQVAAALGVTPGTVKTLLFRARQRLRTLLAAGERGTT